MLQMAEHNKAMVQASIISPKVVRWVRTRLGCTADECAALLRIKPDRFVAMENGSKPVSMTNATKLAQLVLKPVGMLMGSNPPVFKPGVADFRTVGNEEISNVSVQLEAILIHAQECQDWYADMREDNGYAPFSFGRCISLQTPIEEAAEKVKQLLSISDSDRNQCKNSDAYYKLVVNRIERNNILVMQNGNVGNNNKQKLNVKEFRGFALSDKYAPLIFINTSDSTNARTFTLIHEFVHLLLGNTGVSSPEYDPDPPNGVEQYCNAVAAEYLIPKKVLIEYSKSCAPLDYEKLYKLASRQRISFAVVAISALKHHLISKPKFDECYLQYSKTVKESQLKAKKKRGGPTFEVVAAKRFGLPFIKAVLTEVKYGSLNPSDACHLLGIKEMKSTERLGAYVWGKEGFDA